MERRSFLKSVPQAMIALPVSMTFIENVMAQVAADQIVFKPVPGTGGAIQTYEFLALPNPTEAMPNGVMKCALFKFAPNIPFPRHSHPQGEYTFVMEGSFIIKNQEYRKGDFSYMEPNSIHEATLIGPQGTLILTVTPQQIQILPPA